jgi:aspartate carbamoyltransferase catalytic subunit
MPKEIIERISKSNSTIVQREFSSLDSVLKDSDALYVTRVQKERFASIDAYEKVKSAFIITPGLLRDLGASQSLVIMHPLPRTVEIHPSVDSDPRAAYFRQMRNGMFMRMALLCKLFGVSPSSSNSRL